MKKILLTLITVLTCSMFFGQGLEDIICEVYYVSDENDASDTDGGTLEEGSVTYRFYVDMAPGYELQAVYGNSNHLMRIETTTEFFNNEDRGEILGVELPENRLDENTVAVDSYVTLLGASTIHAGMPEFLDEGSIIGGASNDGGSEGIDGGLLIHDDPLANLPLTDVDGMVEATVPTVTVVGLDLSMFDDENSSMAMMSNGGAFSVLEGVQGITDENIVQILQITTTGDLEFELNIQLGAPDGVSTEQYVAANPIDDEQYFYKLNFPPPPLPGCTSDTACNFNPNASEDDGSCLEPVEGCTECNATNDDLVLIDSDDDGVCDGEEILGCSSSETACNYNPDATDEEECIEPIENCAECNEEGTGLVLIDDDDDGVCNEDEVLGCDIEDACNYDPEATENDGTCLIPVDNCWECNEDNTELIIIDSDDNGICDAEEFPGCTDPLACNYNPEALGDDGSCITPVENCTVCNETNDGLILIDSDDDGICDGEEIEGCASPTACNYNPDTTDDIIPCIEPEEDCTECDGEDLVLIDTDGDGICDGEEIAGCTSDTACNYNPEATDNDNSCLEPEEDCWECDEADLVIIDTDGDGVCDGEEVFGCTDPLANNYDPDATEDDGSCIYTSVEEYLNLVDLVVYPNPTSGNVFLEFNSKAAMKAQIEVLNIVGEMVLNQNVAIGTNQTIIEIGLEKYSTGIYFIRLSAENQVKTIKVTKS